jgi:hypothetical protein
MLIPQKVFSLLLIAAFAFGSIACPCPVQAGSEAESHDHHRSQTQSPSATDRVGCEHSECVTDCGRISADSSQQDANLPCNGKLQPDDSGAIEPEKIAWPHRPRLVHWTGPPPRRLWLSHDSPVRRFDRLLD